MPKSNESGHPLERQTAAAFQQSGYFVDRNNRHLDIAEFDVLATRFAGILHLPELQCDFR